MSSLSDKIFNMEAAKVADVYAETSDAALSETLETGGAGIDGWMDALTGGNKQTVQQPGMDEQQGPTRQEQQNQVNVETAQKAVQASMKDTTKLETGKATVASDSGAAPVQDHNNAKAASVEEGQKAIASVRQEFEKAQAPQAQEPGGLKSTVGNIASGAVVGVAAEVVMPGSSVLAGLGSMATHNLKQGSYFDGPEKMNEGYNSASPAEMQQVSMTAPQPAADTSLIQDINHIVEPGLEGMVIGNIDHEEMLEIEAELAAMKTDVDLGKGAYESWAKGPVHKSELESEGLKDPEYSPDEQELAALQMDVGEQFGAPSTPKI